MNTSRHRHEYILSLGGEAGPAGTCPAGLAKRTVDPSELESLSILMLEAYRGTIDYEGETPSQAVEEIQGYFSPLAENPDLRRCSVLLTSGSLAVCACLVKQWRHRECPLIGYIMCHPAWKRRGLAAFTLAESLHALQLVGSREVRAVITEGNVASEKLFLGASFKRLLPNERA